MNPPLAANLSMLYQRPSMWIWHVSFLSCFAVLLLLATCARADVGTYLSFYLVQAVIAGTVVSSLQKDVLTRPFSFCLPHYRDVPRKVVFTPGWAVATLFSVPCLWHPELSVQRAVLTFLSASSLAAGVFYLIVLDAFRPRTMSYRGTWLWVPFLVGVPILGLGGGIEWLIVHGPWITIPLGAAMSAAAWTRLKSPSLFRDNCGVPFWTWGSGRNPREVIEATKRAAMKRLPPIGNEGPGAWESFWLARLRGLDRRPSLRFALGNLYAVAAGLRPSVLSWSRSVLPFIAFWAFSSYALGGAMLNAFYVLLLAPALLTDTLPNARLTLPGGRRERFRAVLIAVTGLSLFFTLFMTALAAASGPIARVMPTLTTGGGTYAWHALDIHSAYAPLLVLPIPLLLRVAAPRSTVLQEFGFGVIMLLGVFWLAPLTRLGPVAVSSAILLVWAVFTVVLAQVCSRKSFT